MASFDFVRQNIQNIIIPAITVFDQDWIHLNLGYEGFGKSTLALWMMLATNPDFTPSMAMPSDIDDFFDMLLNAKKGEKTIILIDEITKMLDHPNSSKTRDFNDGLTENRDSNCLVIINAATLKYLTPDMRHRRVKSLFYVSRPGYISAYSKKRVSRIKEVETGKFKFPYVSFYDTFPRMNHSNAIWKEYYKLKTANNREKLIALRDKYRKDKKKDEKEDNSLKMVSFSSAVKGFPVSRRTAQKYLEKEGFKIIREITGRFVVPETDLAKIKLFAEGAGWIAKKEVKK